MSALTARHHQTKGRNQNNLLITTALYYPFFEERSIYSIIAKLPPQSKTMHMEKELFLPKKFHVQKPLEIVHLSASLLLYVICT